MDFCIPDTDLDIDLINGHGVTSTCSECDNINLTFIDSETFEYYLKSNSYGEYNTSINELVSDTEQSRINML